MRRTILLRAVFIGLCFTSFDSVAQQVIEARENRFSGSLFLRPMLVDNATGVPDTEEKIDELQTEYGATIDSRWQGQQSQLNLNYQLTQIEYGEKTQPDENYWEGESELELGNDSTFYGLNAQHSVRRILSQPEASPILLTNSEGRQITTLSPLLRARFNSANSAALIFNYSDISFDNSDSNDSERTGIDFLYTRNMTPIYSLALRLGQREIDFDTSDFADYDLSFAQLEFSLEHRWYEATLIAGTTEIEPVVGESLRRPTYDVQFNSDIVGNRFTLFATRDISDSSQGNGNSGFFSSDVTFDGSLQDRDQVERTSYGVSWAYDLLCARCSLSASGGQDSVEYINLTVNDTEQSFIDVSVGYEFSRSLSGLISQRTSKNSFSSPNSALSDFDNILTRVELTYIANRNFEITLLHEQDERDSDGLDDYVVNSTSVAFTYIFE